MTGDLLQQIQTLQFADRAIAEALLADFIRGTFPLDVESVDLRPQAVSLNSFNGFLTLGDGKRLFFKTHTEQDNVIDEYYNAAMLAEAGYPIIQPVYSSTKAGQHLLIYEVIEAPSVFDVAWAIEQDEEGTETLVTLTQAQHRADDDLLTIYLATLDLQSPEDAANAPVHQLFWHRITGGRLERFYGSRLKGKRGQIMLPNESNPDDAVLYSTDRVFLMPWEINGQRYDKSVYDLIHDAASRYLAPRVVGPAVIGHGDAHNGNVFLNRDTKPPSLLYFDPAFAGRHHPLLDLTKPLFHNVFAMWMYFPHIKRKQTKIVLRHADDVFHVEYDYRLPAVRDMFLSSKLERVLIPILHELKRRDWLRSDWRAYLKAALFCCPFLTLNLADGERFSPEMSLLGLVMAVEMGAESIGERSVIDQALDEAEKAL
jgi:hypothetical protein